MNDWIKNRTINMGKVVRFLREHPGSTSEEIFKGTGLGKSWADRFIKEKRRPFDPPHPHRKTEAIYFVNEEKIARL